MFGSGPLHEGTAPLGGSRVASGCRPHPLEWPVDQFEERKRRLSNRDSPQLQWDDHRGRVPAHRLGTRFGRSGGSEAACVRLGHRLIVGLRDLSEEGALQQLQAWSNRTLRTGLASLRWRQHQDGAGHGGRVDNPTLAGWISSQDAGRMVLVLIFQWKTKLNQNPI